MTNRKPVLYDIENPIKDVKESVEFSSKSSNGMTKATNIYYKKNKL